MSRSLWAAALGVAILALVLIGWFVTGWRSARFEARTVAEAPAAQAMARARDVASELSRRLESLRAREGERPYYHFQNLFHDPRGASWGLAVAPSPLAEGSGDALIATHFQIDATGTLTIPSINEELPELSAKENLADNRAWLASLRGSIGQLRAPELVAALARPAPPARQQSKRVQLSSEAFSQNAMPTTVFETIKKNPVDNPTAPTRAAAPPVTVTISSYSWATAEIDQRAHLVGRRAVSTPTGTLVQGFVIDPTSLAGWLRERAPGAELAVDPDPTYGRVLAPVTAVEGDWHVVVGATEELAAAAARAASIERRFLYRFAGIAGGALALVGMLVFVVFRAERLARQRSQFAAAAAHELRTPLAGLQLYGDMLADGLGDQDRTAEYARRVADEAGRLGRVVTNVLGFSRLERGALATSPEPGDLAAALRRAIERQRSSLKAAGLDIEVDLPETLTARFDEDAIGQIIGNLLDNAEKYTRDREDRAVTISACATRDHIAVELADSGDGVAPGKERSLFEPFSRLGGDDAPAGLGLGLALSRELARSQGGDLRYAGKPGSGARFVLLVPR